MAEQLSILVTSCDKYSDLWGPFSALFRRYWPDCPYRKILISETEKPLDFFDEVVLCGKGVSWCQMLIKGLSRAGTGHVLMLLDDYLLCDTVSTSTVERHYEAAKRYDAGCMRMIPAAEISGAVPHEAGLFEICPGSPYRIATQAAIWDAEFLRSLAEKDLSPWNFERYGSFDNDSYRKPVLCTQGIDFPFEDSVHKGKWEPSGVRLCQRNGIQVDLARRPMMNNLDICRKHLKGAILDLNPRVVMRVQNVTGRVKGLMGSKA